MSDEIAARLRACLNGTAPSYLRRVDPGYGTTPEYAVREGILRALLDECDRLTEMADAWKEQARHWEDRASRSDTELARLRAPLTRHDWVVSSLQDISDEGISDVIDEACRCLERQAARIAEVEAKYSLSCQIGARIEEERDAAEASLREAREVMGKIVENEDQFRMEYAANLCRAWLAKQGDKL